MRPGKPPSAKFESLGSFLTKRANGSNVSADEEYIRSHTPVYVYKCIYTYIYVCMRGAYVYVRIYTGAHHRGQEDLGRVPDHGGGGGPL